MRRVYLTINLEKRMRVIKENKKHIKKIYEEITGDPVNTIHMFKHHICVNSNFMIFLYNIKDNYCSYENKEPMTQKAGKEYTTDIFRVITEFLIAKGA